MVENSIYLPSVRKIHGTNSRFTFNSCSKSNVFTRVDRSSSIQISTVTVVPRTEALEILREEKEIPRASIAFDFRPGMAQNINPFYSSQNVPNKASEEKQNVPKDNHAVSKRLQKELMVLMMSTEKGVSAFPDGENLFKWIGTITGPRDTVYAGLTYKLTLEFPHSYPYSAPVVRFATPCFHPNVDAVGNICLDILKDKWSALYDVRTILLSIQSLLSEPNNESPLNPQAAKLWTDQTKYKKHLTEEYHRALNRDQQDS